MEILLVVVINTRTMTKIQRKTRMISLDMATGTGVQSDHVSFSSSRWHDWTRTTRLDRL